MSETAMQVVVQKYQSLLRRTEKLHVSYKKAVTLVGGEKRLERLMLEEKIRYFKPEGAVNTMWRFNLADVIKNVKPMGNSSQLSEILLSEGSL